VHASPPSATVVQKDFVLNVQATELWGDVLAL
jgi:hypothetical protein